jgi:hypothetical protein
MTRPAVQPDSVTTGLWNALVLDVMAAVDGVHGAEVSAAFSRHVAAIEEHLSHSDQSATQEALSEALETKSQAYHAAVFDKSAHYGKAWDNCPAMTCKYDRELLAKRQPTARASIEAPLDLDALERTLEKFEYDCDPEMRNALHSTCDHDQQAEMFADEYRRQLLQGQPTERGEG